MYALFVDSRNQLLEQGAKPPVKAYMSTTLLRQLLDSAAGRGTIQLQSHTPGQVMRAVLDDVILIGLPDPVDGVHYEAAGSSKRKTGKRRAPRVR